jgi:hypothetical protein
LPFVGEEILWKFIEKDKLKFFQKLLVQFYIKNNQEYLSYFTMCNTFIENWHQHFKSSNCPDQFISLLPQFIIDYEELVDVEEFNFRRHKMIVYNKTLTVLLSSSTLLQTKQIHHAHPSMQVVH